MASVWRTAINGVLAHGPWSLGDRIPPIDDLAAAAERRTGLDDWGDPGHRAGLEALHRSANALPDLSPLGVTTLGRMIGQAMVNRLRFVGSDVPRRTLAAPVIITGLPRSGTTALHRLMALDPAFVAPRLWELLDPFVEPVVDLRRWRTAAQVSIKNRFLPELDRKHYTRAETPEECTLLLANSFASPLFWDLAPMDGYLDWYQSAPQGPVYREYRRQLEILQARYPDRRLLLKAPAHLPNLGVLRETVPEARLVQIHRDPTDCFLSHCSLRQSLALMIVHRPRGAEIAGHVRRVFVHDVAANLEFHRREPGAVIHVAQTELRRDPVSVIGSLRRELGLGRDEAHERRVSDHVARRRRRAEVHRYSASEWGVTRNALDELFGAYRERFAPWLA